MRHKAAGLIKWKRAALVVEHLVLALAHYINVGLIYDYQLANGAQPFETGTKVLVPLIVLCAPLATVHCFGEPGASKIVQIIGMLLLLGTTFLLLATPGGGKSVFQILVLALTHSGLSYWLLRGDAKTEATTPG